MKIVYVAHPYGGKPENLARARRWLRWVLRQFPDVCPVAPWINICEVLDDGNPDDRAHGLMCNMAVIERCHELWLVGGYVSAGMTSETNRAKSCGVPVEDKTHLGLEPPALIPAA